MNLHGQLSRSTLGCLIAGLLVMGTLSPASGQTYLNVHVTNISISGELSARGLTAAFPHPILATISVTDHNGNPVLGLASTSRWLAPQEISDAGAPVAELWKRVLEYHRDERTFPPNPNVFDQIPAPLFTEFRKSTPFPTSTMLVMDISGSMIEELQDAKNGALAYLDELRPVDRAGVIQFCSFIKENLGFTSEQAPLRAKIAATDTCSGTAIYDALIAAIQQTKLEKTRRAIILYTDGYDNASAATEQAVVDSAKAYKIPIHTIALGESAFPDPLLNIATQSGGRFFQINDSSQFNDIFKQLAALTQNFYMLAYSSPDPFRNGTWRTLDVTVCDTRMRQGSGTAEYFVSGRSQPRSTDLAVALTSFTDLAVFENGRAVKAVQPGDRYAYRLGVKNLGAERAESIRLTQHLPPSVSFLEATPTPFYINGDSLLWQIARLDAGAADSITVTAQFAANAPQSLQRLISRLTLSARQDNNAGNDTARDTVRVVFAPPPPPAQKTDLAVKQFAQTDSFAVSGGDTLRFAASGGTIRYHIVVANPSAVTAQNVRVTNFLPDSARASGSQPAPASSEADSIVWTLANLPPQSQRLFSFSAVVSPNMPAGTNLLINTATARADNEDPATLDDNTAIDTVYNIVKPRTVGQTTLGLNLVSRTDTLVVENGRIVNATEPGRRYDYHINLRNLGPVQADGLRVRQILPDSVRFVSASLTPAFISSDSLVWQIPRLDVGNLDSINVSVQLAPQVPPVLTSLISRVDFSADNAAPRFAMDTVRVIFPPSPATFADLAVAQFVNTDSFRVVGNDTVRFAKSGETIFYRIVVTNKAAITARNVRVTDFLPDSVKANGFQPPPAGAHADSLLWIIPALSARTDTSFIFNAAVSSNMPVGTNLLINKAIAKADNDDPTKLEDNASIDTVYNIVAPPPSQTDLAIALNSRTISTIVENGRIVNAVKPGEPIDYKIRVRNLGLENASDIRVRQLLPDSVRFVGASKALLVTSKDSLVWQIPQLNAGGADSITVTVQFASKVPATLTRLISRADLFSANDNSPANNSASDTVRVVLPPPATDLALTLNSRTISTIVENGRIVNAVKPGEPIDYKIRVRNLGLQQASSIRVRQLLPDSVRFVGASKALSVTSKDSLVWQIPQLNSGGADSITVTVQFAAQVPATLTRLISRADLFSANDNSPANNSAADTVRVVLPPPLGPTDLAVTLASKTDLTLFENGRNVNAVKPGQRYEYRLKVRNLGPERAENVRLRQSLPDSVHFISASKAPAVANRDSLVWQISSLNAGGSDSINVMVQFAPKVPQNLDRLISRLTLFAANDNSPANNVARDTVRVVVPPPAGTRPLIEARPQEVTVGDSVRVRVQVLAPIVSWDLWVYFANNQIDSSYADAYIKAMRLSPNLWHDVAPAFTNTRLFTAAKEEEIRFEIRARDIFGDFATASASVLVRSSNDMVLDRNVFEAESQSSLGINFRLSSNRVARLDVYDLNGVCIAKLIEGPFNAGWNTYNWNGLTEDGRKAGSGVYIIALRSGEFTAWKKCIIVR